MTFTSKCTLTSGQLPTFGSTVKFRRPEVKSKQFITVCILVPLTPPPSPPRSSVLEAFSNFSGVFTSLHIYNSLTDVYFTFQKGFVPHKF